MHKYLHICFVCLISIALLAISGCVNTSQLYDTFSDSPELHAVPDSWSSNFVTGSVTSGWVNTLGNTSITSLVEQAAKNNFALRRQSAVVAQSYADADAVSGGQLPQLNASLDARRSGTNSTLAPDEYVYGNTFDASLQLTWNPDIWGKLSADSRAAAYRLDAAIAGYQQQLHSMSANLVNLWVELVVCRQQVQLYQQRIDRAGELLDVIKQGYQLGLETLLAVRNQEITLINEQRSFSDQKNQCRNLERTVSLETGSLPGNAIETPVTLPSLPPIPTAGLPSELLTRRPDIIQAQSNLKSAYENIAHARAARFPSLTLSASGSRKNENFNSLFSDNISTLSLAAGLAIPIYAFGKLAAQEDAQRAAAAKAEITYIESIYKAIKEVEELLDTAVTLNTSLRLAQQSYVLASESATIAEQQYTAGTSDFVRWARAEITRFDNLATLTNLTLKIWKNRVALHLALGGAPFDQERSSDTLLLNDAS